MSGPIEEIRGAVRRRPFEPFNLTTTDGEVIAVTSPDQVALSQSGDEIAVCRRDGVVLLSGGQVVGAYPREDVAAVALMEAEGRGWHRGFNKGVWTGLVGGFVLGFLSYFCWAMFAMARALSK